MNQSILTNARLVLANEVVLGTVHLADGLVQSIDLGASRLPQAIDLEGDYLLPGLIDLHTDHLEKHIEPRAGVTWPGLGAVLSYEAQLKQAGICTVLDSLCVGNSMRKPDRTDLLAPMLAGLASAKAQGLLAVDHLLHMRLEITDPDVLTLFEPFSDHPDIRLISIMDHSPGQRQSPDVQRYRQRVKAVEGLAEDELDAHIDFLMNASKTLGPAHRQALCRLGQARQWHVASHDDQTPEHVELAHGLGMRICEFPTTIAAAKRAKQLGMATVMGGPNVVNGGSHSGNVAAAELAALGLLDILSSDYVPGSLLQACFLLAAQPSNDLQLAQTVRMASLNVAQALDLDDRGQLAQGLRADLVQVRQYDSEQGTQALVRQLWTQGQAQFNR